ncbi:MAG TPA: YlbF family regulator [Tepidisphaeraceae bacterium]|nr:YlbF family regulator [Tepidisphaeraceae bacterium]
MPVETQQIMDEAVKLGQIVAQHPAVARYKQAREMVEKDAEATRMLGELDRQIESLTRQAQSGMPVTDAQQQQLEAMQSRIVSHIKIKALNLAQVDFVDLLRRVTQTIQRQLSEPGTAAAPVAAPGAPAAGPRITM